VIFVRHLTLADVPSPRAAAACLLALLLLAGCASPCGFASYCGIPKNWPIADTFAVTATSSELCVGGVRGSACAGRGVYPAGTQNVGVYRVGEDDDLPSLIASFSLNGRAGAAYSATCFSYNGRKILGMTEVLTGVEIRNASGALVAIHPATPVTRRDLMIPTC
jgi:hypothetical protein